MPRRWQRGRRFGRLPAQRGVLHLPDHTVIADGRVGRRMVQRRAAQCVGHRPDSGRNAKRGWSGRSSARRPAERRIDHDLHLVAGSAVDDPEHVQDRRRTDVCRHQCGGQIACSAGIVDLRGPFRRDGRAANGIRTARGGLGAGSARPGTRCAGGHARDPGTVRALLRRLPNVPRTQHDSDAFRRRPAGAGARRVGLGASRTSAVSRAPLHSRHCAEPGRLLSGA